MVGFGTSAERTVSLPSISEGGGEVVNASWADESLEDAATGETSDCSAFATGSSEEAAPLEGKATASLPAVKSCLFLLRFEAFAGNVSSGAEYHGSWEAMSTVKIESKQQNLHQGSMACGAQQSEAGQQMIYARREEMASRLVLRADRARAVTAGWKWRVSGEHDTEAIGQQAAGGRATVTGQDEREPCTAYSSVA